jgi:hypothetical protein
MNIENSKEIGSSPPRKKKKKIKLSKSVSHDVGI